MSDSNVNADAKGQDELRSALTDVIAQGLSGTWHCSRVWEAWNVGTMGQDDFSCVEESDTPAELADAVLAKIKDVIQPAELPEFSQVARQKLTTLMDRGYAVTGYALEKTVAGAQLERGFINGAGFVGWWRYGQSPQAAPAAVAVPDSVRQNASDALAFAEEGNHQLSLGSLRKLDAALAATPAATASLHTEMLIALQAVAMDAVGVGAGENTISDAARAKVDAVLVKLGVPWADRGAAAAEPPLVFLPFSVRSAIARRHGMTVTAGFNSLVREVIAEYQARAVPSDFAAAAPVVLPEPAEFQCRTKPEWDAKAMWTDWEKCKPESAADYERVPVLHNWMYEVRRLYTEQQVRALLAGVSAPEAQAVAWDGKLPESLQRALNELRIDCKTDAVSALEFEVRAVFEGMHTSLTKVKRMYRAASDELESIEAQQLDPFSVPAESEPDAQITWPKARDVGRIGDMSPSAHMRVGFDSDNDVLVSVWDERGGGSIEFCNPGGGGGGQSSRTRMALIALMVAMEADNTEKPSRDWWAQRASQAAQQGGDKQ